jgi:predicted nucleotidyltransferase
MLTKFVRLFRRTEIRGTELTLDELPWIPEDLSKSLSAITSFLREAFGPGVSRIGLYGSWQRGDAELASDVDIAVFLNHEVPWFDAINGIVNHSDSRKDLYHWHTIEQEANTHRLDSRAYSIAVVTQRMLDYYTSRGPIHLQNWAHALENSYTLWENRT